MQRGTLDTGQLSVDVGARIERRNQYAICPMQRHFPNYHLGRCGEIKKKMIGPTKMQLFGASWKLPRMLFWIALTSALVGSAPATERVRRDADTLGPSLERLKTVSRVTTAISLTRSLIAGTNKTDEITSELLKLGSATPTQIAAMKAADIESAISAIKTVQLGDVANLNGVEAYLQTIVEIAAFMKNVAAVEVWPDSDAFKARVDSLATTTNPAVQAAFDIKTEAYTWITNLEYVANNADASTLNTDMGRLKSATNNLVGLYAKLKPDDAQFSSKGTAMFNFAQPEKTAKFVKALGNFRQDAQAETTNKANFAKVIDLGANLMAQAPTLRAIEGIVIARKNLGISTRLEHAAGWFEGFNELQSLSSDIHEPWMSTIINSSNSFEKSVADLKTLTTVLKACDTKLGASSDSQLETMRSISRKAAILGVVSQKKTETLAALQTAYDCRDANVAFSTDVFFGLSALVTKLDVDLAALKAKVAAVLEKSKTDNIISSLEQVQKIFTDNPTMASDQLQAKIKQINHAALRTSVTSLVDNELTSVDTAMKATAGQVVSNWGDVGQFYTAMAGYKKTFNAAKAAQNLDLVEKTLAVIVLIRAEAGTLTVYDDAVAVVKKVTGANSELTTATTAMSSLKGKTSAESKELKLLEEPTKTALNIGKSVQAIVLMSEVLKKTSDLDNVIANIDMLNTVLPTATGLSSEDVPHLHSLSGLKNKFQTLKTELTAWKSAVADKKVDMLADGSKLYTPAQQVAGIDEDLSPMLTALGNLIGVASTSPNIVELKKLKTSLAALTTLDLKFANYRVPPQDVDKALGNLHSFFARFTSAMAANAAAENRAKNREGALDGVAGGVKKTTEPEARWFENHWIVIGVVAVVLMILIIVGIIIWKMLKKINRSKKRIKKLQEDNAELKKKIEGMQNHIQTGVEQNIKEGVAESTAKNEATEKKVAVVAVSNAKLVPTDPNAKEVVEVCEMQLAEYQQQQEKQIPLEKIEAFIGTHLKLIITQKNDMKKGMDPLDDNKSKLLLFCLYHNIFNLYLTEADRVDNAMYKLDNVTVHEKLYRHKIRLVPETSIVVDGYKDGFIHANMIILPNGFRVIAMQGPIGSEEPTLTDTCERSWQMYRQQQVEKIVMLCKTVEEGTPKCAQYFPEKQGETLTFGDVTVTCRKCQEDGKIIVRSLHVAYKKENEGRVYTHYHYVGWPDTNVPESPDDLVKLMKHVKNSKQPIVVHCSAGIGRTGVFCYVLLAAQKIAERKTNMYGLLYTLREKRCGMVQTLVQLAFCLQATVAYTLDGRKLDDDTEEKFKMLTECYQRLLRKEKPMTLDYFMGEKKKEEVVTNGAAPKLKIKGKGKGKKKDNLQTIEEGVTIEDTPKGTGKKKKATDNLKTIEEGVTIGDTPKRTGKKKETENMKTIEEPDIDEGMKTAEYLKADEKVPVAPDANKPPPPTPEELKEDNTMRNVKSF